MYLRGRRGEVPWGLFGFCLPAVPGFAAKGYRTDPKADRRHGDKEKVLFGLDLKPALPHSENVRYDPQP